jgi:hypothetical protein
MRYLLHKPSSKPVQISASLIYPPVSADRSDEEEYRKSVLKEISMSEALLQEEHAILFDCH